MLVVRVGFRTAEWTWLERPPRAHADGWADAIVEAPAVTEVTSVALVGV